MKKIMMAAAIVCAAAGIHAAQYNWTFEADDDMGDYAVSDTAVYYMISGGSTVGSDLATKLTSTGADDFTTALSGYVYSTGTLSSGSASGTITGTTDTYAAIFIFNDGLVSGKDFAYSVYDASSNIYTPPASASKLQAYASDWGDSDYAASWGAGTVAAAPEPTSGLLLLLGMAGLALRRKHA